MAANFDLTNLAVTGLAPGNELIYDNAGMPSIMVKIPKMTYNRRPVFQGGWHLLV